MVGIGLLTCVAVGIFVFGRKHNTEPVRYRSVSTVRVAPKPPKEEVEVVETKERVAHLRQLLAEQQASLEQLDKLLTDELPEKG